MKEIKHRNKKQRTPRSRVVPSRKAMHRSLKHIVLLGACSLALGAGSVLCAGQPRGASTLPAISQAHNGAFVRPTGSDAQPGGLQGQQPKHQQQYSSLRQMRDSTQHQPYVAPLSTGAYSGFNPISSPASTSAGLAAPSSPPGVYHSIIDRTDAPSQRQTSSALHDHASATYNGDLHTAAGHHHGHAYGKYHEYRAVPKKKTWKFGYKRGNHKHTISRHEHGKAGKHPHFKTKVKWHDKKSKGKGIHLWDYNHHDKKHYHHGHHG